jgi:hypothetical protein
MLVIRCVLDQSGRPAVSGPLPVPQGGFFQRKGARQARRETDSRSAGASSHQTSG